MPHPGRTTAVLFVCTGNIARSPMAEAVLAADLADRGVTDRIASAGTLTEGRSAADDGHAALVDDGLLDAAAHLRRHVSRRLSAAVVGDAELVVAMTRDHVLRVAEIEPAAVTRTFTLLELAELLDRAGPRRPGTTLADHVATLDPGRDARRVVVSGTSHDVPDPHGRGAAAFRATLARIRPPLHVLSRSLWPATDA